MHILPIDRRWFGFVACMLFCCGLFGQAAAAKNEEAGAAFPETQSIRGIAGLSGADTVADASSADLKDDFFRDASGNLLYVVKVNDQEAKKYPLQAQTDQRFAPHHRGQVVNLVHEFESRFGVQAKGLTSWNSVTFSAFLTDAQRKALAADPRVVSVLPDVRLELSATDTKTVWSNTTLGSGEIQSWGKRAINQSMATSPGTAIVYVIDAGVGRHQDLNVVEWASPYALPGTVNDCGSRLGNTCTALQFSYLVSCYTHSTALAGIIGAKANGTGYQGVNPGAAIVSVSFLDPSTNAQNPNYPYCIPAVNYGAYNVMQALDWVEADIMWMNRTGRPSVINMSFNWPTKPDPNSTNSYDTSLINLEQDMVVVSGSAFIAQAAGNYFDDACNHAYSPANSSDGIMVVGAINNHGQPVVPLNGLPGFFENSGSFGDTTGSDFGSCVETWAPGENILVPVGDSHFAPPTIPNNWTYFQDSRINYPVAGGTPGNGGGYGAGSGTSFAAPHIAGLASYLIETYGYTTTGQVESQIRALASSNGVLGSYAADGMVGGRIHASTNAIAIPTLNPLAAGIARNTPYAEFSLSFTTINGSCYNTPWVTGCGITLPVYLNGFWAEPPGYLHPGYPTSAAKWVRNRQAALHLTNTTTAVTIAMDSYGAGTSSCDVVVGPYPSGGGTVVSTGPQYYAKNLNYGGLSQAFASNYCPSANVLLTY